MYSPANIVFADIMFVGTLLGFPGKVALYKRVVVESGD